jgi:hypothetical protein
MLALRSTLRFYLFKGTGMMNATLVGAYACKAHHTAYTYDASWQHTDVIALWSAKVFYDRRVAAPHGELTVPLQSDAGPLVRDAIQAYIDASICSQCCEKVPHDESSDRRGGAASVSELVCAGKHVASTEDRMCV